MVRKGIKNGLVSVIDDGVDRFFDLYSDNVLRHGTPALGKKFFQRLKSTFGEACEVLTVTTPEGKPFSSVLSFYFRDEVLPYYAGRRRGRARPRRQRLQVLGADAARLRARLQGLRLRPQQGRHRPLQLQEELGLRAAAVVLRVPPAQVRQHPQNNPMNPKYRAFIALWKRLPLGVANRLGPHIVRNLG